MNIIFDVDGTLVQSYRLDTACFIAAVRDVLGEVRVRPDWNDYVHVTDAGILREICADNSLPQGSAVEVRTCFAEHVTAHLSAHPEDCQELPGAGAMLGRLAAQAGVGIGFATGGWAVTAAAKLAHAGIAFDRAALFSSDIAHERIEIMRACLAGIGGPGPVVYVGDGEWDMAATGALGWQFIGIGPRVRGKCERWIADFHGPAFGGHLSDLSGGALSL
ncbi:MAG: HAD hydrolase-like protein [Rhodobacter sp.]|nr:HAD hydrolase-like protein [Rhodobacter sp.]